MEFGVATIDSFTQTDFHLINYLKLRRNFISMLMGGHEAKVVNMIY